MHDCGLAGAQRWDGAEHNVLSCRRPSRNSLIGLGKMPMTCSQPSAIPAPRTRAAASRLPEEPYSGLVSSTVKYLLRTEVHTFAFSVAANAILSFFPFVLLLMTFIRRVFHSPVMYDVVVQLLRDYLPAGQDFVIRNLNALVDARHRAQVCLRCSFFCSLRPESSCRSK